MQYTIIYINDRSKFNIEKTRNTLSSFNYVNSIEFCDGRKVDARKEIENMGISVTWKPNDGRTTGPLPSEFGVWLSNINVYKYIVKNSIPTMLVLEDDAILSDNFVPIVGDILNEVPKPYDFISLYNFEDQNQEDEKTNIGLTYLHRSFNQYSAFQGMIYSYLGAKKILRLLKKEGIEYTVDCQIFKKSLEGKLNGFCLKPSFNIINHDISVDSNIEQGSHRYE